MIALDLSQPLYFTIDDFLRPDECEALRTRIDALDPRVAPITTRSGPVMRTDIRNNERVMFDDEALANLFYLRALPHVPRILNGWEVSGANERFRCYRYRPGQRFAPHYDGAFYRSDTEHSRLTLLVYLNDDFVGGETRFYAPEALIRPRAGMALFFQHHLLHEGCAVHEGTKYVARSDVMYAARA